MAVFGSSATIVIVRGTCRQRARPSRLGASCVPPDEPFGVVEVGREMVSGAHDPNCRATALRRARGARGSIQKRHGAPARRKELEITGQSGGSCKMRNAKRTYRLRRDPSHGKSAPPRTGGFLAKTTNTRRGVLKRSRMLPFTGRHSEGGQPLESLGSIGTERFLFLDRLAHQTRRGLGP